MDKGKIVLVAGGCSTMAQRVKMIIEEKFYEQVQIVNSFAEPESIPFRNLKSYLPEFFELPVSRKERRKRERELKKRR